MNDLFEMSLDCDYFAIDLNPFNYDPTSKNMVKNKKVQLAEWCDRLVNTAIAETSPASCNQIFKW